jgi:hypothetical protein
MVGVDGLRGERAARLAFVPSGGYETHIGAQRVDPCLYA